MNKALYLLLVFLLPISCLLIPIEMYQFFWVWFYIPFAVVYGIFIWFKKTENLMKWITLTPLIFLAYIVVIVPIMAFFDGSFSSGFQLFIIVLMGAIPLLVPVGVTFVLLAYGLYWFFVRFGALNIKS